MAEGINQTLIADAVGGSGGSSDDIRRKLILAMLQEGTSGAPVQHWLQGFDRVGKALLGSLQMRDLDAADRAFQRSQGDYLRERFGPGDGRPPGATPEAGPRPPGAPPLVQGGLPPMGVDPEPPRNPPGTFPVRQATEGLDIPAPPQPGDPGGGFPARDPAQIAQALMGGGGGVNLANVPGGPGSPEDMGPPLRPPSGAAALAAPMPSPTMALQPPQQPAGAMPPGMPPGQPPPVDMRPLTPPAPRIAQAGQAAQPPEMTPAQREKALRLLADRRTHPAVRKQIEEDLSPEWKYQVAGNELWRFTKSGRHERVADATKDPDAVRTAEAMFRNPERFGLKRGADLDDAITQRLSGLTTPENKFGTAAAGVFAKRYETLLEVGGKAQEQIANINSLRELSQGLNTGKEAEVKAALGPWAEFFGIKIDRLGEIQAYEAVSNKMAAAMYVPGTGQQSNFEMQGFLKQVPTLGKTPEGNAIINRTMEAVAEHRVKVSEIAQQALTRQITPQEAEKRINELPNPLALWKQSRQGQGLAGGAPAGGATGGGMPRYNPATGKIER